MRICIEELIAFSRGELHGAAAEMIAREMQNPESTIAAQIHEILKRNGQCMVLGCTKCGGMKVEEITDYRTVRDIERRRNYQNN